MLISGMRLIKENQKNKKMKIDTIVEPLPPLPLEQRITEEEKEQIQKEAIEEYKKQEILRKKLEDIDLKPVNPYPSKSLEKSKKSKKKDFYRRLRYRLQDIMDFFMEVGIPVIFGIFFFSIFIIFFLPFEGTDSAKVIKITETQAIIAPINEEGEAVLDKSRLVINPFDDIQVGDIVEVSVDNDVIVKKTEEPESKE